MKLTQGSIVIIPFPFTNQKGSKIRPALIVSRSEHNQHSKDIWVTAITSQENQKILSFPLTNNDLETGKLEKESFIKYAILFTVEKTLVLKKVADVKKAKTKAVLEKIVSILDPTQKWENLADESPKIFRKYGGGSEYLKKERGDWEE